MTNVAHNPRARQERLLRRAQEVHEAVSRLAEDLREEEGRFLALSMQDDASSLSLLLERL